MDALVLFVIGVTAALTTFVVQPFLIEALHRHSVLDVPNGRSSHTITVPRGGGLGVFVGVAVGLALSLAIGQLSWVGVPWIALAACAVAAAVGAVDDVRGVSAIMRLAFQLGIAAVSVCALIAGSDQFFRDYGVPFHLAVALILVVLVSGFINAFNFMDGANGVSATSTLITGCWFAWVADQQHIDWVSVLSFGVVGASIGFLPWNFPNARVFLGDVGSYFLGATLAVMSLGLFVEGASALESLAPFVIYLLDTGLTLLKRAREGSHLLEPHRDHIYQQVFSRLGHTGATFTIAFWSLVCVGVVWLSVSTNQVLWSVLLAIPVFAYAMAGRKAR